MLPVILKKELINRRLSIREAARQMGIAHTTLIRILQDEAVDLSTLDRVGAWMQSPVSAIIDCRRRGFPNVLNALSLCLSQNPKLEKALYEMVAKVEDGLIDSGIIEDVMAYITFRVSISI
jgi:transcriptional regulator with XRE-family HTH domain